MSNPLLAAALSYARLGWRITPLHDVLPDGSCSCLRASCRPGGKEEKSIGKHPRLPAWQKFATVDERVIRSWWGHWPRANVGIATGRESNLIALDVDVHRGAPGVASLAQLEEELGPLPRTRSARTGSGGRHILFKYPAGVDVGCRAAWLGRGGIDWRGDGGQIVAAPSVAAAGAYTWDDLSDLSDLPARWVEALSRPAERRVSPPTPPRPPRPGEDVSAEDDEVVASAMSAANREKFSALWAGRWSDEGYESQSQADLALCSMIAFWCDRDDPEPDADRIDRVFRRSKLHRAKWLRKDYRDRTIALAVEGEVARREEDRLLSDALADAVSATTPPTPPAAQSSTAPEVPHAADADADADAAVSARTRGREVVRRRLSKIADKCAPSPGPRGTSGTALKNMLAGRDAWRRPARTIGKVFDLLGFEVSEMVDGVAVPRISFDQVCDALDMLGVEARDACLVGASAFARGIDRRRKFAARVAEKRASDQEVSDRISLRACLAAIEP